MSPMTGHPHPCHYPTSATTKFLRLPMGNCVSKSAVDNPPLLVTGGQQEHDSRTVASRYSSKGRNREPSRTAPSQTALDYLVRPLYSKVQEVIPEDFRFRLLVVGKHQSGKSSLIKAIFKVDVTDTHENVNINVEYRPEDNRYLVVHEFSGFESQAGDSQDLRTIQDFISYRIGPSCQSSERLHAIWICISASDAIGGQLGEGVEAILSMKAAPTVLVLTKFDEVVTKVLFNIARGDVMQYDVMQYDRARTRAHAICEDSIRPQFNTDPGDVPVEIVSVESIYADLVENLVMTTDGLILGSPHTSTGFGVPGERTRTIDVPLAWSAAIRVCRDILLESCIEVGKSQYWCHLSSSINFAEHPLKSCVDIIHVDLVEIWNLNDVAGYLLSDELKAKMSQVVADLAAPDHVISGPSPSDTEAVFADWVYEVYRGRQEHVRCLMGYILHLVLILDAMFSTTSTGDISQANVQLVIDLHIRPGGIKDKIHREIRGFTAGAFDIRCRKDLVLEKIIDLIQGFCG